MNITTYIGSDTDISRLGMLPEAQAYFEHLINNALFSVEKGSSAFFVQDAEHMIVLHHTGTEIKSDLNEYQKAGADAIRFVQKQIENHTSDINVSLSVDSSIAPEYHSFIEKWALLAAYPEDICKSKKNSYHLQVTGVEDTKMAIIVEAMQKARDLVSRPANILDTDALIDEIQSLGNLPDTTVSIMRNDAIQQEKMNLLLAVNSGSKDQAAVGVVEYTPKGTESQDPIVLVGKGLIYDSGGLYMKPSGYMNEMHTDMGGAATVVGVMSVLSKIGIQKKVVGICGITENMVDANSFRNGDIITSRKGLTVEIGHTDAEGRLVLADCLSYACDTYKPAQIFDYATLTGACLVALGEMYSGVFSDSQDLIDTLIETGKKTNDHVWPLPFDVAVKKAVKSKSADLTNTGNLDRMMGSSTAAAFLSNFVDDTEKWVHFDIAGTAARDKMRQSYDYQSLYGTGAGVHLTLEYLLS